MTNFNQNAPYAVRRAHFIERAKALWGDSFDYSDLEYTNGKQPCYITCPKHGRFRVGMAQNHILKNPKFRTGCPYCGTDNGVCDSRLASKRKAKREVEKALQAEERKRKINERKRMLEGHRLKSGKKKLEEVKQYLVDKGYDLRAASPQKICSLYGSLKATPYNEKRHAEKVRKEAERKNVAKANIEKREVRMFDWYMSQAKAIHGDKYDYSKAYFSRNRKNSVTYLYMNNIICPIHGSFSQRADVHVKQQCGCPKCGNNTNAMSNEERKKMWVKRCRKKFNNRFDYSRFEYVNNDTKGIVVCREHKHAFLIDPWTHLRGAGGCPYCSGSIGEVYIRTWLENHHVNFDAQYRIPNNNPLCKRKHLRVDFFLSDFNIIVEMNGQQHYQYVRCFHTKHWSLKDQQIRDDTLRDYCKKKKITLLEIKYDQIEQIPDILSEALKGKDVVNALPTPLRPQHSA